MNRFCTTMTVGTLSALFTLLGCSASGPEIESRTSPSATRVSDIDATLKRADENFAKGNFISACAVLGDGAAALADASGVDAATKKGERDRIIAKLRSYNCVNVVDAVVGALRTKAPEGTSPSTTQAINVWEKLPSSQKEALRGPIRLEDFIGGAGAALGQAADDVQGGSEKVAGAATAVAVSAEATELATATLGLRTPEPKRGDSAAFDY